NYRGGGVLSDDMLRGYEEDGVIVIRNLVSPKLLDRLDEASRMLMSEIREGGMDDDTRGGRGGRRGGGRGQFHMVKNGAIFMGVPPRPKSRAEDGDGGTCDANFAREDDANANDTNVVLSSFRDLAMYSKIPRVAASLLRLDELRVGGAKNLQHNSRGRRGRGENSHHDGGDVHIDEKINLRICRDIFLTKDDDDYACGWHVDDTGFWPSIASDPGVNAWVALDDMPWPWSGSESVKGTMTGSSSRGGGNGDGGEGGHDNIPVATFALSFGSHRMPWRHRAYEVTGSTHTLPSEGYTSAIDLIERRSGNGTCNIQTSAPDLYEKLERNKVVFDIRKGDVIFHDRWVFHRTVTVNEYEKMARGSNSVRGQYKDQGRGEQRSRHGKIFRRYSIRYAPGNAVVPPGYGVEPSVLHDSDNANRTLDEIVERSGPWYPKVWPHVTKKKPLRIMGAPDEDEADEEIEGITDLVYNKMPKAEEMQKERKNEIQQLLRLKRTNSNY
ncbi:hypothetical protein ACHAXA_006687, partial [Cyclostephanos tholiformis]